MTDGEKPVLEICVDDAAGLDAALEGGADRIELCAALGLGGLTPPSSFMRHAARVTRAPVNALIRPRPGDFVYSPAEIVLIADDIAAARDAGLAGVVMGVSRADGSLDRAGLERLVAAASGLDLTLHRAFDLVPDPEAALELAIELGFARILTSGGARTAIAGRARLIDLARRAGKRISIMPGSGVDPAAAADFVRAGFREIHASAGVAVAPADGRIAAFGFVQAGARRTDVETVRALKAAVSSTASSTWGILSSISE